jgi:hypothetical protein
MSYCNDVDSVLKSLGHHHKCDDRRLFIDASKAGPKGVLCHTGNGLPLVIFHATHMKESFENIKLILSYTIQHTLLEYGGHLKATALPVSTQLGFRKLCYSLCEWDSHAKESRQYELGQKNVKNEPLVHPKKIFLPPLRMKLGMVNFFKGVDHNGKVFQFLQEKFPQISESTRKDLLKNKNVDVLLRGLKIC